MTIKISSINTKIYLSKKQIVGDIVDVFSQEKGQPKTRIHRNFVGIGVQFWSN